jgi:hypothetical protein
MVSALCERAGYLGMSSLNKARDGSGIVTFRTFYVGYVGEPERFFMAWFKKKA